MMLLLAAEGWQLRPGELAILVAGGVMTLAIIVLLLWFLIRHRDPRPPKS